MKFLIILILLLPSFVLHSRTKECFLLMAGKKATSNGKILLAHNNDLSGNEASMVKKIPAGNNFYYLPDSAEIYGASSEILVVQIYSGFAEGDAAAINEYGVAIAGGLSLKRDRSKFADKIDPLIPSGLGGGIRYYALRHAKSARQCIQIIGQCYDKYGIAYPSAIGVADSNEIWYMEAGGGHSWVAIRVPDSCYIVAANSYRIGNIDFHDTLNFIYSKNLPQLSKTKNFNFAEFFGGGVNEKEGNNFYNTRRIWQAIDLLNPSLRFQPDKQKFPVFLKPENKISLPVCFNILRNYYQGTKFNIYKNGKYSGGERPIATWKGVHTEVISITPGIPVDYGCILWAGLSSPFTAVYVPYYYGINKIYKPYTFAPDKYDSTSAFWIFKTLGDLSKNNYPEIMKEWTRERDKLESEEIYAVSTAWKDKAKKFYDKNPAILPVFLNAGTNYFAKKALNLAKKMREILYKK